MEDLQPKINKKMTRIKKYIRSLSHTAKKTLLSYLISLVLLAPLIFLVLLKFDVKGKILNIMISMFTGNSTDEYNDQNNESSWNK
jgi:hypothetical protein